MDPELFIPDPVPILVLEKFRNPVPDTDRFLAQFFTKNCTKSCLFNVRLEPSLFPRKRLSSHFFIFWKILYCVSENFCHSVFIPDLDPNPASGSGSAKTTLMMKIKLDKFTLDANFSWFRSFGRLSSSLSFRNSLDLRAYS